MSASRGSVIAAVLGAASLVLAAVALLKDSDPPSTTSSVAAKERIVPSPPADAGQILLPEEGGKLNKAGKPAAPTQSSDPVIFLERAQSSSQNPPKPLAEAKPRYQPGPSKFKNATRPEARKALAHVGSDFQAEALWLQSINDPSVPANERKDLIEDLNEDGFSDPSKPTREDLMLINSRIQLIDRLLPSAVDKVNADAFAEARKDLVNMRARLEE